MTTPPPSPPDPWAGQPAAVPPNYVPPSYPQPAVGGYGMPVYPGSAGSPPGYPPSGYPGPYPQPGYPAGPPPMAAPPVRPTSVIGAFWLWMVIMVFGIASTVLLFSGDYFDKVAAALRARGFDDTTTHTALAVGAGVARVAVIVSAAAALFIYLFFGLKMYAGRHWARVVLTVLGGLSVLSGLTSASSVAGVDMSVARPSGVVGLAWVQALFAAVAIILMYLPDSNRYFRESRIYRAERRQIRL